MTEHYDLIVIGSGPAGEKGAAQAAYFGRKVALIERNPEIGGAGINTGTVPSKTLREAALYFSGLRQRGLYGIDYSLKENLTVKDFMYRERTVVRKERKMIAAHVEHHDIERQAEIVIALPTFGLGHDVSLADGWHGAALGVQRILFLPGPQTLGHQNSDPRVGA